MSFARKRVQPHVSTQLAPCERSCLFWAHCGKESVACRQFENFVNYGWNLDPPTKPPTREIFDRIFNHYNIGRPPGRPHKKRKKDRLCK